MIDGKLQRIEMPQSNLKSYFISLLLFCFKLINYKHVYAKDEYDRPIVKEIIEIRGLRTCLYDNSWGQRYVAQFMWKIGNIYF